MQAKTCWVAFILIVLINFQPIIPQIVCDENGDCYYVSNHISKAKTKAPALIILHCDGATAADLDTFKEIGNSLEWIIATCHATRNHRDVFKNDSSMLRTIAKLIKNYSVDSERIFLFGFSGQGVQALATLFMHPEIVRGVIAVCAHAGTQVQIEPRELQNSFVYLITRERDWNRTANLLLYENFNLWRIRCTLNITPGEHSRASCREVHTGCVWLKKQMDLSTVRSNAIK